jgi:hypothetical protein
MKSKLFIILGLLLTLGCLTHLCAQETKYYRPFEFQIDGFGEIKTPDLDRERSAAGVGVNLFFTENFGMGVSSSIEDTRGSFVDHVSFKGIFRVPVNRFAFYVYGGATRQLKAGEWSLILGPGGEFRFTPNVGLFTEIGMDKQLTGERTVTAQARTGLRVSF